MLSKTLDADNKEVAKDVAVYGQLFSSCGSVLFDVATGEVVSCALETFGDYAYKTEHLPVRIDTDEWLRRYPGEDIAAGHDILDFGYWMKSGKYEPPCEDWRKDREAMQKEEKGN